MGEGLKGSGAGGAPAKSFGEALKLAISANLGWGFELFDFVVYLYAGTVIAQLFFPSSSKIASLLEFYLTLVIGYFARPVGAVIFGHYGDRIGRKALWFIALLGMGIATISIGFLPTYEAIGILAPILIVTLRIIQGLFLAGEWGGGMTFVVENAPDNIRGLMGGIQQGGAALGLIFAVLAFDLASALAPTPAKFASYGWRIMFWFGVVPLAIALAVRWKVSESVEWLMKAKDNPERIPIATVFRRWWRLVIISTLIIFGESVIYYGIIAYMPDFLTAVVKMPGAEIATVVLVTNLVWLVTAPIFGYISDVIKSRKLYLAAAYALIVALVYPVIRMLYSGNYYAALVAGATVGLLFSWQYSVLPAFLGENISTRVRYSYIAFVINVGVAFSSFAPYLVAYMGYYVTHSMPLADAFVALLTAVIALVFTLVAPHDRVGAPLA
ncbi:MAG: MFS transporter [Acidilobus sp.]|jgi:MFS family permease